MTKRIDEALAGLLREARSERAAHDRGDLTHLGLPLLPSESGVLRIDMSEYKVLSSISSLVAQLAAEILDQANFGSGDIMVQKRVTATDAPELAKLGLSSVCFYARSGVADDLVGRWADFRDNLAGVLYAIQSPRWGGLLFPDRFGKQAEEAGAPPASEAPPALLFPLHHLGQETRFFLIECERASRFLRITLESSTDMRLQLRRIPHRVVPAEAARSLPGDILGSAEAIFSDALRACSGHRTQSYEDAAQQPALFKSMRERGFEEIESIVLHWTLSMARGIQTGRRDEWIGFIARLLFVLVDEVAGVRLREGNTIEVRVGGMTAYLDASQRQRCINVSIGERRDPPRIERYIKRMVRLRNIADRHAGAIAGHRVVLIHHVTAEILATIHTLSVMGCEFLHVHFVQYARAVPQDFLDALLALPEDRFLTRALQHIEVPGSVEGTYILSPAYSPIGGLEPLSALLAEKQADYLTAMRISAIQLFFAEACKAREGGQKLLLIEDGGYVAPVLNTACLQGLTVGALLDQWGLRDMFAEIDSATPLTEWLHGILPGTIEHTRNGYDALDEIQRRWGHLQFPACSIAISRLKRGEETWQVSQTILNAVESVVFGEGFVLSSRRALVLGCEGAIGSHLMRDITMRLADPVICGVDIALPDQAVNPPGVHRARSLRELPREFLLDVDLIVGVVGRSIVDDDVLEDLVLNGTRTHIFFASGSTKTVEFTHLIRWLDGLLRAERPEIQGRKVHVQMEPVTTAAAMIVANRVRIEVEGGPTKILYLLAGLMPVNFLFYGVPTEVMDRVLEQLLQVTVGMVRRINAGDSSLPPRLLAVDHQIDADANTLPGPIA